MLDEQLLGRSLESEISVWYRGPVRFVHELRPKTVLKDDAIPVLLRAQPRPTFVTINSQDFWRKIEASDRYCVVCLAFPDSEAGKIPAILKRLLRHPRFATKAERMEHVIRYTSMSIRYYTRADRIVRKISW